MLNLMNLPKVEKSAFSTFHQMKLDSRGACLCLWYVACNSIAGMDEC